MEAIRHFFFFTYQHNTNATVYTPKQQPCLHHPHSHQLTINTLDPIQGFTTLILYHSSERTGYRSAKKAGQVQTLPTAGIESLVLSFNGLYVASIYREVWSLLEYETPRGSGHQYVVNIVNRCFSSGSRLEYIKPCSV